MPPPPLPPQTPTRALLNRIRRRSHVAPAPLPPQPRTTRRSAPTAAAATAAVVQENGAQDEADDDDEHAALERHIDALLEAGESKDKIIADLKKHNAELRTELRAQKALSEELKLSNKKRLNDQTLSNLENEFHQQENILQGLQRDNEEKTIEIERVRRKDKVLSDYLHKLHGEDWAAVVSAAVGGASVLSAEHPDAAANAAPGNSASAASAASTSAIARILASAQSSRSLHTGTLERSLSGRGGPGFQHRSSLSSAGLPPLPPTEPATPAREREPAYSSSPSKTDGGAWADASFVSAVDSSTFVFPGPPPTSSSSSSSGGRAGSGAATNAADLGVVKEEDGAEGKTQASPANDSTAAAAAAAEVRPGTVTVQQLELIRASIESTRLLVQGYLRSDAARRTSLAQMVEDAERRAKEFEGVLSVH